MSVDDVVEVHQEDIQPLGAMAVVVEILSDSMVCVEMIGTGGVRAKVASKNVCEARPACGLEFHACWT